MCSSGFFSYEKQHGEKMMAMYLSHKIIDTKKETVHLLNI